MTAVINRRSILAAGVVALPSIAIAGGGALSVGSGIGMDFHKLMEQAGKHLKGMRQYLEDLDAPGARDEAAFLANQVTILMAQCVMVADQAPIPERSEEEYDGDKERFDNDLRIKLTYGVTGSAELGRALLMGEDEEAVSLYGKLRKERKEGHNAFKEDD